MSWRFPDKRATNTGVMGIDDANDEMLPVVEEASGRLNENNWASGAFTSTGAKARFSKDMAYRHFRKHVFVVGADLPSAIADAEYYSIPNDSSWHVPTDSSGATLSHTFDSVGGVLYICARSWIQIQTTGFAGSGLPVLTGVKVNGALIPESICGNMDIAEYSALEATGFQFQATAMSEITIPIAPGRTTVEVVARIRFDATSFNYLAGLGTRSLVLWEIAR